VVGVTDGFQKTLVLVGTGYRAQAEGMSENKLNALIERSAAEEDKKDSKKK